jgi:DNA-binding SARP family transcriptional activator
MAARHAEQAVAVEPFRETGYQRLMRAHAAAGNRAEALRVYERCRCLLAEELGVSPSPQTEAVYLDILRL